MTFPNNSVTTLDDKEAEFQAAQEKYFSNIPDTEKQESWEKMWALVYEACKAIGLKLAKKTGVIVPDLEEKILDGTIYVMSNIKDKGVRIDKLSSYCYLRVYCKLYAKKTQEWERTLSYDAIKEDNNHNEAFFKSIRVL